MSKSYTHTEKEHRESQIQDVIRGEITLKVNDYRRRVMDVQAELMKEFDAYRAEHKALRPIDPDYIEEIRDRVALYELRVSQQISAEAYKREVAKIARVSQ